LLGLLLNGFVESFFSLSLIDLDAFFSSLLAELLLAVDVVHLGPLDGIISFKVLLLEDPILITPLSKIGLLFGMMNKEVAHELQSVCERLVAAHEAEVPAVVPRKGILGVVAVDSFMVIEPLKLDVGLA
jgi:hypothetical protein